MTEKQQTAVQWLYETWLNSEHWDWSGIDKWFEKALEMEREQMRKSFNAGWYDRDDRGSILDDGFEYFIEYFTDTYQTEP